ncbi:MAG: hypothetical protein ACR5K7_04615 [Symbiopectobacterium sp.]
MTVTEEIAVTENQMLEQAFNQAPLVLRLRGFFQTNQKVAATLYWVCFAASVVLDGTCATLRTCL